MAQPCAMRPAAKVSHARLRSALTLLKRGARKKR